MWFSVWVFVCGGRVRGQFMWVGSLLVGALGIFLMPSVVAASSQRLYPLAELWEPLSFLFDPHACDKIWLPQKSCFHVNCKISEGMKGRRLCNEYLSLVTLALSSSESGDILFRPRGEKAPRKHVASILALVNVATVDWGLIQRMQYGCCVERPLVISSHQGCGQTFLEEHSAQSPIFVRPQALSSRPISTLVSCGSALDSSCACKACSALETAVCSSDLRRKRS